MRNIPQQIDWRMGRNYHRCQGHPICTVKEIIYRAMIGFTFFDELSPIVPSKANFDDLRVPLDHPSRKPNETYYSDKEHVLRTRTTAHLIELLKGGERKFLVTGDVFRKDRVDPLHYPIFHQMDGVSLTHSAVSEQDSKDNLIHTTNGILRALFPGTTPIWKPRALTFLEPSFGVTVDLGGNPVEMLSCGIVKGEVLQQADLGTWKGWVFTLGLDRIAMKLFKIPDIRLLWSTDHRFVSQFKPGVITPFEPFGDFSQVAKEISFWIPEGYDENDFFEVVRSIAGDLVEEIVKIDAGEKDARHWRTYKVTYRSLERNVTKDEVAEIHDKVKMATKRCCFVEIKR